MLQIKNLSITHKKDLRVILNDFSCVLNDGDKAVIIGEEGNGKSTLLKWIYDEKLVDDYCETEGELVKTKERIAYLPQELPKEKRTLSVCEFFMEEESFLEQTPKTLGQMAAKFHVPADFFYREQPMETLSGGEKVKAQMMKLLLTEPTVLLLDEPSNDIDVETLEWLEQFIQNWKHIALFISHDETLIENTANMIIHIEQIRRKTVSRYTIAKMSYEQYRKERLRNFENQERQAESERREKKIREEKLKRIYQSVDYAQETISRQDPAGGRLLKKKMHAVKSMERRFEKENENMTEMPEQEGAIFFKLGNKEAAIPAGKTVIEYELPELWTPDGERILAENIFLRIRGSEKICITGKNGVGKTTLLHKIAEELLNRNDIHAEYMPQNYEELLQLHVTPVEYLDQTGKKEERTKIRTFLGALKYTADEMDHPIAELSGGQKAKIFLLKMSMSGANVLILDEPTSGLDPAARDDLLGLFLELVERDGASVLFSTHITSDLDACADTITYIRNGEIFASEPRRTFTERYRYLRADEGTVPPELAAKLIAPRRHQGEIEGLLRTADAPEAGGPATLEQIMVYLEREVEA